MRSIWRLAGIDRPMSEMFATIGVAIEPAAEMRTASLDVAEIGKSSPHVLVCDVDRIDVDPLEFFRRLRFVLPDCTIVALTGDRKRPWAAACHLAGVSCVLAKSSTRSECDRGIRSALEFGYYTDPRFEVEDRPVSRP